MNPILVQLKVAIAWSQYLDASSFKGLKGSPNSLNCQKVLLSATQKHNLEMTLKPKLYIMIHRSYPYAWIYYCTHQYLLIFLKPKIKNSFQILFQIEISDFNKIFCYEFKLWKCILGVLKRLLYFLFIEVIFEGSCFELDKSVFDVKHTYTF